MRTTRYGLLLLLFATSGFTALVYQVVWQRQLTLVLGSTVHATGIVLAAFLGGLAAGAAGFGRVADRWARPLILYAWLELAVAASALATKPGFRLVESAAAWLYASYGPDHVLFGLGRLLACVAVLGVPTAMMGGTLPALARYVAASSRAERSERVGLLYAANTLGAALGALATGMLLVVWLGFQASLWLGATVNALVGVAAMVWGRSWPIERAADAGHHARSPRQSDSGGLGLLVAASFVSGAVVLALEVLWTRALVLHLGSHVSSFSLMLATVLFGLAAGGLIASRALGRVDGLALFALLQLGGGVAVLVGLARLGGLSDFMALLAAALGVHTYAGLMVVQLAAALQVSLLPALLLGGSFAVVLGVAARRAEAAGRRVGLTAATNTLGTVVGALAGAFYLVPAWGTPRSMVGCAFAALTLGVVVLAASPWRRRGFAWLAVAALWAAAVGLVLGPAAPDGVLLKAGIYTTEGSQVLAAHEGMYGLVTIEQRQASEGSYRSLSVNGVNVAGTSPDLVAVQKLQGHVPMLVHGSARSVLHIGFGSGGTAWSVSRYPVEQLTVVEINPDVLELSSRSFMDQNHGVLDDPRLRVIAGDGRNILTLDETRYDVILSDSIHPAYAGNSTLYTRDYYEIVKARLKPGGVVSQWLPLSSISPDVLRMILRAFTDVFPNASVWYVHSVPNAFTITVGSTSSEPVEVARLQRLMALDGVASDLAEIGVHSAADLLSSYMLGGEALRAFVGPAPAHVDDRPLVEYPETRHARSAAGQFIAWTWYTNLKALQAVRQPPTSQLSGTSAALEQALADRELVARAVVDAHLRQLATLLVEE